METNYLYEDLNNYGGVYNLIFPFFQKPVHKLLEKMPYSKIDEIWLFGSIITNLTGIDSDIDICIVGDIDIEDTKGLWSVDKIPVDLIWCKKNEFYKMVKDVNSVFSDVFNQGVKIYGR
ncbi:MAG: nucleotidyltransferase domain-containing protein [Bacillota bacterium]|nr:nucleotidyltransferase domain-containing protein [Bacillota bacterium]